MSNHELFQKNIHREKFYQSADNFTIVTLVTNIMSVFARAGDISDCLIKNERYFQNWPMWRNLSEAQNRKGPRKLQICTTLRVTKCTKGLKSLSTGCIARCSSKESSKNWMCINSNFFWKASFLEVQVKLCLHKHHLRLCSQKYEISKLYQIKTALEERQILEMLTTNIKRTFQEASKDNPAWLRNELEKGLRRMF